MTDPYDDHVDRLIDDAVRNGFDWAIWSPEDLQPTMPVATPSP